jgi:uncharacterized protein YlaI
MENKEIHCALCGRIPEVEEPAVLTLGKYGKPRHLCEDCEAELDVATLGRDYDEIVDAIDRLGKKATTFGKDDPATLSTMKGILMNAAKRAAAIKDGEYDFDLDENPAPPEGEEETEGFDEIPEELRETEEDRIADEKEAAVNKKWDKIITIVAAVVFIAVIGYLAYRFIAAYFL